MDHALAVGDEPVGDIGAVTVRRVGFGAHDAGAAFNRRQGAGGGLELLGLHVVDIRGAHAAEGLAFPAVSDARLPEGRREGVFGKVRVPA